MARKPPLLNRNSLPIVTSASAASAASAVTTVAITSASASILALAGLVYGQLASHELFAIEFLNSGVGFLITGIGHKAKAA